MHSCEMFKIVLAFSKLLISLAICCCVVQLKSLPCDDFTVASDGLADRWLVSPRMRRSDLAKCVFQTCAIPYMSIIRP